MTGGIIQLASYGTEDLYLTNNPQITFFKIVYRRHTNFSIEEIPQYFPSVPGFGKKATCVLSRSGDLISQIHIVIHISQVLKFINADTSEIDTITRFAWVRKLGYKIIRSIEIEIGGQSIDKQYGEWLYILNELLGPKTRGNDIMIGNVEDLYQYSNGKKDYKLFIPLQFWFCKHMGTALPIVALRYSDIKINVELSNLDECYIITPTHYIIITEDLVCYIQDEYIEQTINGVTNIGQYAYYDPVTKMLYYRRISNSIFISYTPTGNVTLDKTENEKYIIVGKTSNFVTHPQTNTTESYHSYTKIVNIDILNCFLLVNYIFLDSDERLKFSQTKHEYLIEQVNYVSEKIVEGINRSIKIDINQPCSYMIWFGQQQYLRSSTNNDIFNYTDSYVIQNNKYIGKNLIDSSTIQLNGHDRLSFRNTGYFNWVQPYQHFIYSPQEGINVYSFCISPSNYQPTGSCNMSKIDNIVLKLMMKSNINFNNVAIIRVYAVTYNILRIVYGLCGVVFS